MPIVRISSHRYQKQFDCSSFDKANKLTTVKKCVNEVLKYGGPFNARDLYPVSRMDFHTTWVILTIFFCLKNISIN